MKQKLIIIASFFFLTSAIASDAFSQWVQTGPYGGDITAFAVLGSNLFAGTSNAGIFRSSDNGTSWTIVQNGLPKSYLYALVASGTDIFAAINGSAFRSTNRGMSWTEVNNGLPDAQFFAVIGTDIYAAEPKGVFRSTNSGNTWIEADSGIDFIFNDAHILSFIASGKNLFAGTSDGLYLSTDNGISWNEVDDISIRNWANDFDALAVSGKNLFAVTYDGILRSSDNGVTWSMLINLYGNFTSLFATGTNIFAGIDGYYGGGIYRSTNNGASWTKIQNGLPHNSTIQAFCHSGTDIFAGEPSSGIFRSTDNGTSWGAVNNGLTNVNVTGIAVLGANIFSGAYGAGISKSTDNGASWAISEDSLPYVRALDFSEANLFAETDGGTLRSIDNGKSWTKINGFNGSSIAVSGTDIFIGTTPYSGGVFLSTDNGTSWTVDTNGLHASIQVLAVLGTNLFAGTSLGIFRTNITAPWSGWSYTGSPYPKSDIRALAISGTNLFAGTNGGGVYLSIDTGKTWAAVNNGLTNSNINALATLGTNIFAGTDIGVFFSTDNGTRWSAFNNGLSTTPVNVLAASATSLFAGTSGNGVWRRPLSEMTTQVQPASDTQAVLFSGFGTMNVTLSGDSARNRVHRIDFVNNSNITLVITNAILTTSNNRFSISQLLPGVPDTVQPGAMFSMIVNFLGDTSGTVYQDSILLMIDHALTSFYVSLNGKSFATQKSAVSLNPKIASDNIRISPNPFSNFTTIHYSSHKSNYAEVSIYDILGIEVTRIFSGELDAGEHSFAWDAHGKATGMYIAIIKTSGEIRKLSIMLTR